MDSYILPGMRKPTLIPMQFKIDADLREGLEAIRQRDGVSYTEQLRRALRLWFDSKGLTLKSAPIDAPRRVRRA